MCPGWGGDCLSDWPYGLYRVKPGGKSNIIKAKAKEEAEAKAKANE